MSRPARAARPASARAAVMPDEHREQCAVIEWAELQARAGLRELQLLYAVPNGGARHPAVAGRLKAEGVKKGVPDLQLPVGRGGFFGLYVEMKRLDGGETDAKQRWWHAQLREQGYAVHVACGATEAIATLRAYLSLKPTPRTAPAPHVQD